MQQHWLIYLLLVLTIPAFGQQSQRSFSVELHGSVNETDVATSQRENRFGVGTGALVALGKGAHWQFLAGAEYNYTRQHFATIPLPNDLELNNIGLRLHTVSLPVGARFNVDKRGRMFVDAMVSLDSHVKAQFMGNIWPLHAGVHPERAYEEQLDVQRVNAGFQAGIGIAIPAGPLDIVVKPEYKINLRPLNDWPDDFKQRYFNLKVGVRI